MHFQVDAIITVDAYDERDALKRAEELMEAAEKLGMGQIVFADSDDLPRPV
jgi:hypothetical protein